MRLARRREVLLAYDEDLANRVRAVVPRGEAAIERQMFGGLAFMLGGHMFCGVVKDALMVRLGPGGAGYARGLPPKDTRPPASASDVTASTRAAKRR